MLDEESFTKPKTKLKIDKTPSIKQELSSNNSQPTIPKTKTKLKIDKTPSIKQLVPSSQKEEELRYPVKLKYKEDGTEKIKSAFLETRAVLLGSLKTTIFALSPELKAKHDAILNDYEVSRNRILSALQQPKPNTNPIPTYNQQQPVTQEPSVLRSSSIQQQIINPSSPIPYFNQIPILSSSLTPEMSQLTYSNIPTPTNVSNNFYQKPFPSPPMDPLTYGPSPPIIPPLPQNVSELRKKNWLDPFSGINLFINKINN
jgi:hypothetical protein